ncbi:MFS transporter [Rhodococcus sp. KBS0724]|uniref:MFS transporter n=1 Tax=Rhodococcus sp. KBS0724 TaxID=1179674 RepID=UPI00110F4726|nr:MFS transporter [Rhodococcus sp. KBS0724]TSD47012.1 MFS transporter [Rhodococcus sp. KBS0724]
MRHEGSTTEQLALPARTVRKVMLRFMPVIGLAYIVLYLDRLNIGVAALTMNKELGISASMFGFAAGIYFWSYTICEPPSNYILTKVGARRWITRIMITWGIVTIGTAFVQGASGLVAARFLLGIAEAGFSPGMLFFVSKWFPNRDRGKAMAWIVTFICFSGLGTPITTHLMAIDGFLGLSGWRWVFILTGVPAVVMAFVIYKVLRDKPSEAEFLTEEERGWLTDTLEAEAQEREAVVGKHSFLQGLVHPRVLVLIAVFICFTFSLNGFQIWMPQIYAQFGMTTTQIGWVAALPALIAIGPMIWWTRHSDRAGERPVHFAIAASVAALGFAIAALFFTTPVVAIFGFCIAGIGLYSSMSIFITMPSSFLTGAALAAGFGVINGMGNLGGYFGPQVTGWIKDATNSFTPAIGVYSGVLAMAALIVLILKLLTRKADKANAQLTLDYRSERDAGTLVTPEQG